MQYKIRLAKLEEKDELLRLYSSMVGMPGCTWNEHYPNMDVITWDINDRNVYCLYSDSGEIIAAASAYSYDDDELHEVACYTSVGKWAGFARIAVSRAYQKQGFARLLLEHIIDALKKQGFDSVRLLVSEGNAPAVALYERLGFKKCGAAHVYEQDWLCYELLLDIEYKENILTADDYLMFESKMGDALTTKEQAERSIANQLFSVAAMKGDEHVGIARLVGDAAIFWCIVDVWVLPEYQGRGIGSAMVRRLIRYVKENSIPGTSVSLFLMCAKGKEGFYEKLGFLRRPHEWEGAGMEMELDIELKRMNLIGY